VNVDKIVIWDFAR